MKAIPIIKVVGDFCNLRCEYCFYHAEDQITRHVMDEKLLEKFLSEYMKLFSGHLIFIWHGGEPLLAGLSFFKKIIDFQKTNIRPGQTIQNNIQTNATLINDEWAEFFKRNGFKVGVSLDGSQKSHNQFRKDCNGKGSFSRVVREIETLRRHGIDPGFIQTITRCNSSRAKEDFIFFTDILNAKGWGINAYLDIDRINDDMINQEITNEDFIKFLKIYIDLWLSKDNQCLRIREIDNFISGVINRRARNCVFNGSCANYFCLEYDGTVYACRRFESPIGKVPDQNLFDLFIGSKILNCFRNLARYEKCKNCPLLYQCRGCGAVSYGISGNFFSPDPQCWYSA